MISDSDGRCSQAGRATEPVCPSSAASDVYKRQAYKCPKRVIAIGELPVNAIGKLDRERLRELAGRVRG